MELKDIIKKSRDGGFNVELDSWGYNKTDEEKEESFIKETLPFLDLNSEIMERDEEGKLKTYKDLEALESYLEYRKDVAISYPTKEKKFLDYIEKKLYKESVRTSYKLTDEEYVEFIKEMYRLYEENDRGDMGYYSLAFFDQSYALRMGRKELTGRYGYSEDQLPEKDFLDGNILLEDKSDRAVVIAMHTALGDEVLAKDIVIGLATRNFHPATPTYSNSGLVRGGESTSCYIFSASDNMESIVYLHSVALQKSKRGGGIGYDLTNIRARGESIKGVQGVSKGIIPVAKMIESAVSYADQDGKRPGSAVVNLSVFHADIEDFLNSKKENAEDNIRLKTLSTAIITYDKFWELVKNESEYYYTFYPKTVYDEYGVELSDIDFNEMYDELVLNPRVRKKKFRVEDILNQVARLHGMRGYPYIIYFDNANNQHAFYRQDYLIRCSNLCSEIFQLSVAGEYDIQCTLSAINISEVMKNNSLEETAYTVTRMLNNIIDVPHEDETDYTVVKAREDFRAIGVGVLDFHGFIANHGIAYESLEAKDFARTFFMLFNYYSLLASNKEVERYGKFKDFDKTKYADGTYFDKYLEKDYNPVTDKVRDIFETYGVVIPNKEDWKLLKEKVQKEGLANAYRNCIQPTGSISYLSGTTPSMMPIHSKVERRSYKQFTANYPVPNLNEKNFFLYKEAHTINMYKYLDLIAVAQEHIDQGISATLFITDEISTDKWIELSLYANERGLKSLYYSKTKLVEADMNFDNFEECISCT